MHKIKCFYVFWFSLCVIWFGCIICVCANVKQTNRIRKNITYTNVIESRNGIWIGLFVSLKYFIWWLLLLLFVWDERNCVWICEWMCLAILQICFCSIDLFNGHFTSWIIKGKMQTHTNSCYEWRKFIFFVYLKNRTEIHKIWNA